MQLKTKNIIFTLWVVLGAMYGCGGGDNGNQPTDTPLNPSNFVISPGDDSNALSWVDAESASGYIIIRSLTEVESIPTNGSVYSAGDMISNTEKVVFSGNNNEFSDEPLDGGTQYYYKIFSFDSSNSYSSGVAGSATPTPIWSLETSIAASNAFSTYEFGNAIAIDGDTMVVGSSNESSNQNTITNGTSSSNDTSLTASGAVYVFRRIDQTWIQEAYIKAPNVDANDQFGFSVDIDGDTIIVGAPSERSSQNVITNGTTASDDDSFVAPGAAYIFRRTGNSWAQEAYLKAPNVGTGDRFGYSVAIDGDTAVVSSPTEDSNQNFISTSASTANNWFESGAVYVFKRSGSTWASEAYIKPTNPGGDAVLTVLGDLFGYAIAIDGDTIAVGSPSEDTITTLTNGDQGLIVDDNNSSDVGSVYVFKRSGTTWSQESYLKASNAGDSDNFGVTVAIDGDTIVAGATGESSSQNTISNGSSGSTDNSFQSAGAAYVFKRTGTHWAEEAYLKPSNPGVEDKFGHAVAIDGDRIAIGAFQEDNSSLSIFTGTFTDDDTFSNSGAVYIFERSGSIWSQEAYVKARVSTTSENKFGKAVSISGDTVVGGATEESIDPLLDLAGTVHVIRF